MAIVSLGAPSKNWKMLSSKYFHCLERGTKNTCVYHVRHPKREPPIWFQPHQQEKRLKTKNGSMWLKECRASSTITEWRECRTDTESKGQIDMMDIPDSTCEDQNGKPEIHPGDAFKQCSMETVPPEGYSHAFKQCILEAVLQQGCSTGRIGISFLETQGERSIA